MAKELYASVNGLSKKTKQWYCSVNGLSKKVLKAYCSVNGLSKQFYGAGGISKPWLFFETVANKVCQTISYRTFFKTQNGIAFFAIVKDNQAISGNYWTNPFYVSTDPDAVHYTSNQGGSGMPSGSFTYNNLTWYWEGFGYSIPNAWQPILPEDSIIEIDNGGTHAEEAADALDILMPSIYASGFSQNYVNLRTYSLNATDNIKALKRAFGIFLIHNVGSKNTTWYQSILTNLDTFLTDIESNYIPSTDAIFSIYIMNNSGSGQVFIDCIPNYSPISVEVRNKTEAYGFTSFIFNPTSSQLQGAYALLGNFTSSGYNIYTYSSPTTGVGKLGVNIETLSGDYTVKASALGIQL